MILAFLSNGSYFTLTHTTDYFLGWIEHSFGVYTTDVATHAFSAMGEGTFFTEVVLALGDHRINERFSADEAFEGQVFVIRVYFILAHVFGGVPAMSALKKLLPNLSINKAKVDSIF